MKPKIQVLFVVVFALVFVFGTIGCCADSTNPAPENVKTNQDALGGGSGDKSGAIAGAWITGVLGVIGAIAAALIAKMKIGEAKKEKENADAALREANGELADANAKATTANAKLAQVMGQLVAIESEKRTEQKKIEEEGKRATQELIDRVKAAQIPSDQEWAEFFRQEVAQTEAVAKEIALGSRMIVVASGRGGVGKSTLSLSLMEYYSRDGRVLLVDFDMPNRGLTSLLSKHLKGIQTTYTLDEMERFSVLFRKSGLSETPEKAEKPKPDPLASFRQIRDTFVEDNRFTRKLQLYRFGGKPVRIIDEAQPVIPDNAFFLPSVKPGDLFLSSGVFGASFLEVFYFLKCLAHWAKTTHNIGTIIIDCHGAHDLFMVGAIHASTELIVTTTPDPGSFDGTFDLLAFADKLKTKLPHLVFPSVLAINNCRDWQESSREAIEKFFRDESPVKLNAIVGVQATGKIRDVTAGYQIGKASQSEMWGATKTIGGVFENEAKQQVSNLPPQV
jgi:hypothetical protein